MFAIALTLLVLDLRPRRPELLEAPGRGSVDPPYGAVYASSLVLAVARAGLAFLSPLAALLLFLLTPASFLRAKVRAAATPEEAEEREEAEARPH